MKEKTAELEAALGDSFLVMSVYLLVTHQCCSVSQGKRSTTIIPYNLNPYPITVLRGNIKTRSRGVDLNQLNVHITFILSFTH